MFHRAEIFLFLLFFFSSRIIPGTREDDEQEIGASVFQRAVDLAERETCRFDKGCLASKGFQNKTKVMIRVQGGNQTTAIRAQLKRWERKLKGKMIK